MTQAVSSIFYWVFNMSIVSTVVGGVIVLLRLIKKIPRRVIRILWVIPAIRAVVPVFFGGRYGLMSLISRFATKTVVVYESGWSIGEFLKPDLYLTNSVIGAAEYFPIVYKTNLLENLFTVSGFIWISVAAAIIIALGVIYFTTMKEMKSAVMIKNGVYVSDKVTSPAVYGIFRPKIVVPSNDADSDLTFVLMHERAHIKAADNFWRIVAFFIAALHWFNPLAWIFLKLFLSDIELACDERVLSKCTAEQKKQYAGALLDFAPSKSVFSSAFGGAKIRTRIENILSYKKMTVISAIGSALLIAAAVYTLLTNAS